MAILQALISYLSRSAGKALNAIFGWAVVALFGQTSPKEQTILSAVVAAAAAWPLLLLGTIVPKVALVVIAFVPLAKSVPSFWLRIVWIALALVVPIAVGIAVARRGTVERLPEPVWKRLLRGFPITLALAAAFLVMLVVAPVLHFSAILRRRSVVRVPALMDKSATREAMAALAGSLAGHGVALAPAPAPWHMVAPSRIMLKIGGKAFARMANERVEYRANPDLSVAVLPNETVLRGKPHQTGLARALCTEIYGPRAVMQTLNPEARAMEAHLKRVWNIAGEQPERHIGSPVLLGRVREIAAELATKDLPWDDWQIVYRLLLQLESTLKGETPLFAKSVPNDEERLMADTKKLALPPPPATDLTVSTMSNRELVSHVMDSATLLAKKEIQLAKAELKEDLKAEIGMAKNLGIGAVCALCFVNMLLVAGALALGLVLADWVAALVVAGVVLAAGAVFGFTGWKKRVKNPLESTRRSLKEDALWVRERLA